MARDPNTPIKPLPFPGESPTVALAMAAGDKFGFHEKAAKPARAKRKDAAPARKKTARSAGAKRTAPRARRS